MLKKGFTLAEVLITLSIIGVVSALTIPALFQESANAEIEPKLRKAQTGIVQANKTLLYDQGVDRMSETGFFGTDGAALIDTENYMRKLGEYLKYTASYHADDIELGDAEGWHNNETYYLLADGISVAFYSQMVYNDYENTNLKPHNTPVGHYFIDINGRNKPNARNKDIFYFRAYDDGSARRED